MPLISTFPTKKGEENLGPSCAESSRAQEIQVYIYPKAAASAGLGLCPQSTWTRSPAGQAGEMDHRAGTRWPELGCPLPLGHHLWPSQ